MAKKKPILALYKRLMETKQLTNTGLCHTIGMEISDCARNTFDDYFHPKYEEFVKYYECGYYPAFWAYEYPKNHIFFNPKDMMLKFTPLRETFLLLFAAVEGELK